MTSVDKKTLRAITISASVVFAVAVVLLVVWAVRRTSSGSVEGGAKARGVRMALDLETGEAAQTALESADPTMVFVYADWCGFCKRAAPIFDELATDPAFRHIKMLKLNSAKASKFVSQRGIRGYPVFLTNWGDVTKIVGYKPKGDMEVFLRAAPKSVRRDTPRPLRVLHGEVVAEESVVMKALQGEKPAVVFVSADWCGFCKKLMPVWEEVAASGKFSNITMMRIDAKDAGGLVKQHGITGFPVLLSNKGEGKYIGYRPKEKLEEILVKIGSA